MTPLGKSATGLWRARKTPQSSFTRQLQMAGHHLGKKLRMIKAPHSAATLGSGRPGDEVHRASNNEAPHGCTQPLGHLLRVAVLEGNYKVPRRTFMYEQRSAIIEPRRYRHVGISAKLESKPADSHIARAEVADESGEELMVYRRSVPWATAGEQGLMFVSFGADTLRHDMQMRQMYGMVDDAIVDRLLDFTTPDTGSFWRCPSVEDLDLVAPLG